MKKIKGKLTKLLAVIMALALCVTSFSLPAFADTDSDTTTLTVEVTYCQSMARSMLSLINEFRTDEDEAWYWDEDNATKIYATNLDKLIYDYSLEKVAMQRAAEIAVSYSHTRPNGTDCWTAYDGVYVYSAAAENIAAGYTTAANVFEAWQEANESYSGQGHRRNMLSSSVTSIGIACVYYNGYYYWVQDFGSSSKSANTTATDADDSKTEVEIEVLNSYITAAALTLSTSSVTLTKGETAELPTVTLSNATITSHWPTDSYVTGTVSENDVTWESADTSIASIGSIVANSVGSTTFTATVADKYTAALTVIVEAVSIAGFTATLSQDSYEYDGTAKTPSVTVTDTDGNTLTADTDYAVSYSDNTEIGTATVTITGTGDYTGTLTKTFTITECSHTYGSEVTKDATCSKEGIMTYTCSKCGDTYTESIDKLAHTEGDAVIENEVDATCTEDGSYDAVIYCTVCGEELSRETTTIAATGHAYDYNNITWTWADDYSSATATVTCANNSSHTYIYEAEISASADSSTCTNGGEIVYTASITADDVIYTDAKTVETEAKGHTAGDAVIENEIAATCTETGSYESVIYCAVCGEELSKETVTVDALGHSYDDGAVTTEPTCTEDGVMTYTCSVCGDTYTESINATGHTESEAVIENEVEATCTKEGSYDSVVYCSVCGEELSRDTVTVNALGHSYDDGVITTEPTCTEDGVMTYTCSVCGDTYTESIEATGHTAGDAVIENEVEATCTEEGSYDSVVYCSVCGEELSRDTVTVDALGHSYDDGVITTEPTCTEDGVMTYTCSVCGDTYTESIDATGHTAGDAVIENETEATCTEDGSYNSVVYCSVCGEEISRETVTVDALGHSYDDGVVTTEPTCTEEGVMTYTCTVCGDTYTGSIDATGHTESEAVIENEVEATCTEEGSYDSVVYCSVCGEELSRETIATDALGHSYNDGIVTTEVTCTQDGVITFTCSVCGDTYTATVDALGHSYDSGTVTKEATEDEEGEITYTCTVCGDTYTETIEKLSADDTDDDITDDNTSDDTGDDSITDNGSDNAADDDAGIDNGANEGDDNSGDITDDTDDAADAADDDAEDSSDDSDDNAADVGQSSNMIFWVLAALLCELILAILAVKRKKELN